MHIVGTPFLEIDTLRDRVFTPISQMKAIVLALKIPEEVVVGRLREEYLSIVLGLKKMKIDFRIAFLEAPLDQQVISACLRIGCKFAGMQGFQPAIVAFPRDMSVVLPSCVIVHHTIQPQKECVNGCRIVSSPLGEGGMVLLRGKTAVISERICGGDNAVLKPSRPVDYNDLEPFRQQGIKVGLFPSPVMGFIKNGRGTDRFAFNDHIDRVACLIEDRRGKLHLFVDHDIVTTVMIDEPTKRWESQFAEASLLVLENVCGPLNVTVHRAPKCSVPYALNMLQVEDGRILMTSGATEVEEMIRDITSQEVFTTEVPITLFPAWKYGGIRCLVSEMPTMIFKSV
jgi:hypothetical protein